MTKIVSIFSFLSGLILFASCSSSRTGIFKTYSFYKINTPGTIPVDDNGKPIGRTHDTAHIIYFETAKGEIPKVTELIVNKNYYKPILTEIKNNSEEAGILLQTNKSIIIKSKDTRQLWKVERGNKIAEKPISDLKDELIYLSVIYEGRNAMRIIKKHHELVPELHY